MVSRASLEVRATLFLGSTFMSKKQPTFELASTDNGFSEAPDFHEQNTEAMHSLRRYDDYSLVLLPQQKPNDPPFTIWEGFIYVRLKDKKLQYLVLSSNCKPVSGVITESELEMTLNEPLDLEMLQEKMPLILKVTSERGHTSNFRSTTRDETFEDEVTVGGILSRSKELKLLALQACSGILAGTVIGLDQKKNGSMTLVSGFTLLFIAAGNLLAHHYFTQQKQNVDKTTSFKKFNQSVFDANVQKNLPDKAYANQNCAGHVKMWHKFHSQHRDYIDFTQDLSKSLSSKKLSPEQEQCIDDIIHFQLVHRGHGAAKMSKFFVGTKGWLMSFNALRKDSLLLALEKAVKCPGTLVCYLLKWKFSSDPGHMTGIIADKNGQIKFFDPGNGEATFADSANAKIGISCYLAYEYGIHIDDMGPFLWEEKEVTTSGIKSKM